MAKTRALPSFSFYFLQVESLLVDATYIRHGSFLPLAGPPVSHPQTHPDFTNLMGDSYPNQVDTSCE